VSSMATQFVSMTRNFLTVTLPAFYTWLTTMAANMYNMAKQSAVFKGGMKALKKLGGYIKYVFVFMGNMIKRFILVPIRIAVVAIGSAISTAFAAAVAYIGAIPLAIAAAVIGLVILAYIFKDYLEIKWGEFKTWFGNSMDRLSELANSLGDWISEKWDTYVTQPIQKFITMIGNLVNMITDKIGEYKSNIGILSKEARTQVDKARESGLYDEDAVGKSELKQDMVADAPTQQLQAILEDNDLSDENKKFVQQELDSRNEGYYLGAMSKIDSSDSMSNSGDDIADGTLNASNAANLIVTNIQQNSNQSNSNGTVVVSGNPTVVDVDPSAGKGNNMGWGSFAGQGGYN
jgi:NADH:ubiquinone oxidoreductase subunit K